MATGKMEEAENTMEHFLKRLIPWIAGLMVATIGFYITWFSSEKISRDSSDWGTLGDYFGGLMNPIISFATLMIAYAVWKQQKRELHETKKALEEQAQTAEQQRREQRFFDLLAVYRSTIDSIEYSTAPFSNSARTFRGKTALSSILRDLPSGIAFCSERYKKSDRAKAYMESFSNESDRRDFEKAVENSIAVWPDFRDVLLPYFRTVFTILFEIEHLLNKDQQRYVRLFRSQITPSEAVLIGLFLAIEEPQPSVLHRLIEKYTFLSAAKYCPVPDFFRFLVWHFGDLPFSTKD